MEAMGKVFTNSEFEQLLRLFEAFARDAANEAAHPNDRKRRDYERRTLYSEIDDARRALVGEE